jgi:hypothetical protein
MSHGARARMRAKGEREPEWMRAYDGDFAVHLGAGPGDCGLDQDSEVMLAESVERGATGPTSCLLA